MARFSVVKRFKSTPENLPPRPWYLGGQWFQYGFMLPEDMLSFCNHFDLKMTYDICHAQLFCNHSGCDLESYTKDSNTGVGVKKSGKVKLKKSDL